MYVQLLSYTLTAPQTQPRAIIQSGTRTHAARDGQIIYAMFDKPHLL